MRILMAASEMSPLARTGGLGDVMEGLPGALEELGHEVSVILPYYQCIRENAAVKAEPTGVTMTIEVGGKQVVTELLEAQGPNEVQMFLVKQDEYFERPEIYGPEGKAFEDNAERFVFLSKAVVELARRVIPSPDILHVHDWQTALAPVFLKQRQLPMKTVLTIHNIAYQGSFWGLDFGLTNLPGSYFSGTGIEFYGRVNFLKGGILYADALTTVSEHYARDIQTGEFGAGLDAVVREHAGKLRGILNGADYRVWNPATDGLIAEQYSAANLKGKKTCKGALLEKAGLDAGPRGPVFCMVGRLAEQKGFDIVLPLLDRLLADDVRLVVLGEGDMQYARELTVAAKRNAGRMAFINKMDDGLAHAVYAGADMMLAPSHFEPGGISVMQALKYGTVPIARASGGLHQILTDYDPSAGSGNGFLFYDYTSEGLWDSMMRGKRLYAETEAWGRLMKEAMGCDFSWKSAAEEYVKVYEGVMGVKK
jgi:starch synthase